MAANDPLDPDQLKRRIVAARTLRGLSQREFASRCRALGLGSTEAARVERGDLQFQATHRLAFAAALSIPERWFTEPSVDALVGYSPPDNVPEISASPPDDLRAVLEQALALIDQAGVRVGSETTTGHGGGGRQGGASGVAGG